MELSRAKSIAERITTELAPCCGRVEIAGSIRRGKADVGDIEIVAIPKWDVEYDLFGAVASTTSLVDIWASELLRRKGAKPIKNGSKYKQLALAEGINLDLFLVTPPAQWGVIYTVRTGPSDFSTWLVTNRLHGGAMPNAYHCLNGHIEHKLIEDTIQTPEEEDLFRFLELDWIEPAQRRPMWWRHG